MTKTKKRLLTAVFFCLLLLIVPTVAAHPLGNFTISRYSRLTLSSDNIQLTYIVDMAEIPTFQQQSIVDANGDGRLAPAETAAYRQQLVARLTPNLHVDVNGAALPLRVVSQQLSFPPGQGDLPTTRLEIELAAALPADPATWQLAYQDDNYAERPGWQEVVVTADETAVIHASTAPAEELSNGLRKYPADLLQRPLALNSAQITFAPVGAAAGTETQTTVTAAEETAAAVSNRFGDDSFANLLTDNLDTPTAVGIALLVAFGLGAAHALTPGHGKTIVGAYLVGSRGNARHALLLGLTTTITHTAGVFALGLVVLFASQFILPEQLFPWLGVFSGLLIVGIGISLIRGQWRRHHADSHAQETGYHTHFGVGHTHTPAENVGWRGLLALGVSGGLIPCPSALVLLLSAIALQQVGFGLLLIAVFSLGLAAVLTGIGLLMVSAGRFLERLPFQAGRMQRLLPLGSALFITIVGIGMTGKALLETAVF